MCVSAFECLLPSSTCVLTDASWPICTSSSTTYLQEAKRAEEAKKAEETKAAGLEEVGGVSADDTLSNATGVRERERQSLFRWPDIVVGARSLSRIGMFVG